ncbi:FMN-dependent dehydrogenase domain-containing protein [Variovorax paradoxus B4]|uniref:FMN-dependent dehydrogenase domain-containing protein n=1 Tax=Variovorax paradoxus B4 TaxID=1246301 RepID=T1X9X5_VARPD|nr:alpha-hydroxy-acid oxidizing protein [Variovorax paradoxus]AGU49353.1 FMN-dependent dehydrogenase domain-containing protein [Variovorax paradoxus B4]
MLHTLDDCDAAARQCLPRALYGFAANGSERGASVLSNTRSFERRALVPQTVVDVSSISQTRSIVGTNYASHFGIAPMGVRCLHTARISDWPRPRMR